MTHTSFFYHLAVFRSRWSAFFAKARHLHTARFANLHELTHLFTPSLEGLHTSILLGTAAFSRFVSIRPTLKRQELGNTLICAPPPKQQKFARYQPITHVAPFGHHE